MKHGRLIKAASKPKRGNTGTLPANRRYAIAYPINNRRITNTAHPHLQELKPVLPWVIHREFIWDPTETIATRPLQFRMPDKKTNHFYMFDGNKNVSDLIYRVPANGVAAHYEYAPFGAITRTHRATPETQFNFITDNPYRFSSEYHDDDLALTYYNYRHYNPLSGRWLTRDPVEHIKRMFKRIAISENNLFSYIKNGTLFDVDVLGLLPAGEYCDWGGIRNRGFFSRLFGGEDIPSKGNCWRYACNDPQKNGEGRSPTFSLEIIEVTVGCPPDVKVVDRYSGYKCETLMANAKAVKGVVEPNDGKCPCDHYAIKGYITGPPGKELFPTQDYHWYRQNDDGTWSHKPGDTAVKTGVTDTDEDAKKSDNPVKYPVYCGMLCIPNTGVDIDVKSGE